MSKKLKTPHGVKLITWNGRTKNITEWATDLGVPRRRIYDRLRQGWSFSDAILRPLRGETL